MSAVGEIPHVLFLFSCVVIKARPRRLNQAVYIVVFSVSVFILVYPSPCFKNFKVRKMKETYTDEWCLSVTNE
jgi:hypothetical protein